ncbi:putative quinol monooxygenase [Yinghuangia seranimata]|uniref:putative quinol monooxygenase n=1 Tax=Yinghuangia seranimata TaxID=408067 RepID=UPI00248BE811|nr:antibiotic biosynthesis monooxygenase [Yinghuangia seranimata]MDI2130760.1 antibiotic biosynthesis monooxygenase [Yinghuangia seranimata]
MLVISGFLTFKPEDRDEVVAGLLAVSEDSRKDAGCVEYWWAEELERPNTFRFFEAWETPELFEAHRGMPYEEEFNARYLPKLIGVDAHVYTVTERTSALGM